MSTTPEKVVAADRRRAARLSTPALVGRSEELATLVATASHPPSLVLVEGEAGVGKTRLVNELGAALAAGGAQIRTGRCHPQRTPFPLQAVLEALGDTAAALRKSSLSPLTGILRPLVPELADVLPAAPEPLEDTRAQAHQVFRAVREVLAALGPTALVLEDLHWADETTAELLHFLVGSLPPQLSLVLTYRNEDLAEHSPLRGLASRLGPGIGFARIALQPLHRPEVAELIGSLLDVESVSEEFAGYVYDRTEGIPFAVEEVVSLLVDRQDIVRQGGTWARRVIERIEVPRAIRDAVVERLAHLSPMARRLVSAAAVVGRPSTEAVLAGVSGLAAPEANDALSELLVAGWLVESERGALEFRHVLALQAVYEAVPAPRRRHLNLQAANHLQADPATPAARLAEHYREAGRAREWLRHGEAAADQALARFDEAGACRLLLELLDVPALSREARVRLTRKLARAAPFGGAQEQAMPIVRRVLEQEKLTRPVRGELRLHLALLLGDLGRYADANAETVRSLEDVRSTPALAVQAMIILAHPPQPQWHLREHRSWLEEASEAAARTGDRFIEGVVAQKRAAVALWTGEPGAAESFDKLDVSVLSPKERRAKASILADAGAAAIQVGHYRLAERLLAEARSATDEGDELWLMPRLRSMQLLLDWSVGRWDGLSERAQALCGTAGHDPGRAIHAPFVRDALALASSGGGAGLDVGLQRVMATSHRRPPLFALAASALAGARLQARRPEAALEAVEPALEVLRAKGAWVWAGDITPVAVLALVQLGRIDVAAALVEELAGGLAGRDAPAAEAALLVCRGTLAEARGELTAAAEWFRHGSERWATLPRPYSEALAAEAAGRLLLDADPPNAVAALRDAFDIMRDLGATRDAARLRQLLHRRGIALPSRGGGRSRPTVEALSAREIEIAELVAKGHTNREIAGLLYLSPRTVGRHLERAMRKQGVTSRWDLASAVVGGDAPR